MDGVSINLIVAQIINFGILFFLFKHFLGKKIVDAIEERRNQVKASEQAEEQAQEKMEEAEKQAEEIIDNARSKAAEIEKSASDISKKNAQQTIEKAENEADHIVKSAKSEIEKERLDMIQSMRARVIDVAMKLNEKVFGDKSANKDFMEKEYDALIK